MDNYIDDFFIPDNEIRLPEELDYNRVDEYIRSAEAFSRSSYQSRLYHRLFQAELPVCVAQPDVSVRTVAGADEGAGLSFLSRLCAGR